MTWLNIAVQASQWAGAILILLGIFKMKSKDIHAPIFLMLGGISMLIYGVLAQAGGVMLVNGVAVVLNYQCWRSWINEERI